MAGHEKRLERAEFRAQRALSELGRDVRMARLNHDLSQQTAASAARLSQSSWARIERGRALAMPPVDLARALAVVGLDLQLRAYPGGAPLRDVAHVALLERLRTRLGPGAHWSTEVPLPNHSDWRAWDALIRVATVRIGVEAETRAHDTQELQRRLELKRRDGGVDHLILLLRDTRHNRSFVRSIGDGFRSAFPLDGRTALARLSVSADPGGSSIILL